MINLNELADDEFQMPEERSAAARRIVEQITASGDAQIGAALAPFEATLVRLDAMLRERFDRVLAGVEAPLIAARDELRRRLRETVVGAEAARLDAMRGPQPHRPLFVLPPDHRIH